MRNGKSLVFSCQTHSVYVLVAKLKGQNMSEADDVPQNWFTELFLSFFYTKPGIVYYELFLALGQIVCDIPHFKSL